MESLDKILFWEKPIQNISRKIAKALPFMSDTTVTHNVAQKLGTTSEGAHMAMIGLATFLTPGLFKIIYTPMIIAELIRAYKKDGSKGLTEAGKWYLRSSIAIVATTAGSMTLMSVIKTAMKKS
ncbi:MAG: hypothetical protein HN929_00490 [Chloroflexi bacterium]|nr:hypothetical protein [Chloroflexota bacterium]MBT7079946.1 hypothetical protein [Chloroflexota bacterium]MBT7290238.1 hypothetical protein [Chloroflexota bacterium]